jgi:hypothetical protein
MKTLSQLNEPLSGMRRDTADYALMLDNDAVQLVKMRRSPLHCGRNRVQTPVIEAQAKFLR